MENKSSWKKTIVKFLLLILVLFIGYIYTVSHYNYSEGTRTGYLSKFSKKGFVFKTYEADLYIGGANASNTTLVNNLWSFSVLSSDDEAINALQSYEGKVIKVHYKEVLRNMPWQGDTKYFVYKVEYLRDK